jgi:hypothetical protein
MKRAKLFLTAITVLTIVGGALAFKAHKAFNGILYCSTTTNGCNAARYDPTPFQDAHTILFCTPTETPGNCPDLETVTIGL